MTALASMDRVGPEVASVEREGAAMNGAETTAIVGRGPTAAPLDLLAAGAHQLADRLSRPYVGEAWRLLEEAAADAVTIDTVLTGAGGFRQGPFAMMDTVGHDVDDAATRGLWVASGFDRRFLPSPAQAALIRAGRLGRASGRGVYDHTGGVGAGVAVAVARCPVPLEVVEHGRSGLSGLLKRSGVEVLEGSPEQDFVELPCEAMLMRCSGTTAAEVAAAAGRPVVLVDQSVDDAVATAAALTASPGCPRAALAEATGLLQGAGLDVFVIDDVPGMIVTRTLAMIVNLAVDAVQHALASAQDVETAVRSSVLSPFAPLEWARRQGPERVLGVLDALARAEGDPRYRASTLLRRWAAAGGGPLTSLR